MLKWPERAGASIRKLFEPLQDIDVFVEDTDDEPFYRCILNKAGRNKIKIARVFGMGGKPQVIAAAKNHDQKIRRALFIIDGDLPWVQGDSDLTIIGLHRHDAYCVENLLLCEKALSTLLSQDTVITEEDAVKKLAYKHWVKFIEIPLIELFSAFATVHRFDPCIPTVSFGVGPMCTHDSFTKRPRLDLEKVRRERDRALDAARSVANDSDVMATYKQIFKRIIALPWPLDSVSGKDFLLPLIHFHLQSLGSNIKKQPLRMRLASLIDPERFAPLTHALTQAAKGYT